MSNLFLILLVVICFVLDPFLLKILFSISSLGILLIGNLVHSFFEFAFFGVIPTLGPES